MPIYYLDASSITKLYLRDERGTEFMDKLVRGRMPVERLVTSAISIVEVKAAISRRVRDADYRHSLIDAYDNDWREIFETSPINEDIIISAGRIAEERRLRSGDAIHLATALAVAAVAPGAPQMFMVSSDAELLAASHETQLGALDPQTNAAQDELR